MQPGVGNPVRGARDLYAEDMDEATLRVLREPPRHRLRAGQSAAGAASELRRAGRLDAGRQRPQRAFRPRGLRRVARRAARGVQRARHRADLRRGVRRLPAGAGRRAGILRRARRHGDLRQDRRRRSAGRRALRPRATSCAAFARTGPPTSASRAAPSTPIPTSWAPCTNSCSASTPSRIQALYRGLDGVWNAARPSAQRAPERRASAGAGRQPVDDLDARAIRSRRATTGCFNIICARRASR